MLVADTNCVAGPPTPKVVNGASSTFRRKSDIIIRDRVYHDSRPEITE